MPGNIQPAQPSEFPCQSIFRTISTQPWRTHLSKLAQRLSVGAVLPWAYEQWLGEHYVLRFLGTADLAAGDRLMWVAELMAPRDDPVWRGDVAAMVGTYNEAANALNRGDMEPCNALLRLPRLPSWLSGELRALIRAGRVPSYVVPTCF